MPICKPLHHFRKDKFPVSSFQIQNQYIQLNIKATKINSVCLLPFYILDIFQLHNSVFFSELSAK